jgi:chromosome segregation protein
MLKIEKMQISGFKSFSETTEVVFPDGITAVVGPNGCGKSNIGDAINWVLGEQSAKMLRGSSMQDVIFNGTDARKPQGMAEVSLHLAGRPHANGAEKKHIQITRRLFRDGESDYLLNGAKSRLRDIQDLLREERVGAQTYATIEQGRIDQILNAKPKDRRLIIEEAAGIAGFKHKRRLAELKLEATHANLLRVNDIVLEVARQIGSLKRQAAKARRYGRLREELHARESVRFGAKARRLDTELTRLREDEAGVRSLEAASSARLATLEAAIAAERTSLEDAVRAGREATDQLHQLEIEIDRGEARVTASRERIVEAADIDRRLAEDIAALSLRHEATGEQAASQANDLAAEEAASSSAAERLADHRRRVAEASATRESRRDRVEHLRRTLFESMNRLADLRNTHRSIEEHVSRLAAQRERLEREREAAVVEHRRMTEEAAGLGEKAQTQKRSVEEIRDAVARAETDLAGARAQHTALLEQLASARERETASSSALRTLEDVATRFAGASDGVRLLLTAGGSAGVRTVGVVADFVDASREIEVAAEAYLQGVLPAVVVEDDSDASRAAGLIRSEGAGRTMFLCKSRRPAAAAHAPATNGGGALPQVLSDDPRVIGRLKERLRFRANDGFVGAYIGDAVLVDSLESALALHHVHPMVDFLAATGEVVYASGMIAAGGRVTGDLGLFAHNRKMADAQTELTEASSRAAALQAEVDRLRGEVDRAEAAWADGRRALETEGKLGNELEMRRLRTDDEKERVGRRLEILAEEIEAVVAEAARLAVAREEAGASVASAEAVHALVESELAAEVLTLDADEAALRLRIDEESAARADAAAREERVDAARRETTRLAELLAEIVARRDAATAEREAAIMRGREAAELLRATEVEMTAQLEARRVKTNEAAAREEELIARRAALQEQDAEVSAERTALDAARARARECELNRTRAESDRRFLDELCLQELGVTAEQAAVAAGEDALSVADDRLLDSEIADIKAKVEAIGPVNLMAIDEFRALEERHAHLSAQQKDLVDAMASLRETIKRINRNSRDLFLEAFETIRSHYVETFKVLFNGGRADLILEEGDDVLECGIEMIAQPPGKRLGSVSLMSGGEKSMAALALLFAIFRYQPSPFCLLDEVDAALDELNVGRFTRMLSEYAHNTQFILITHNKRSMEAANLLYGVTMEEAGVSKLVSLRL